MLDSTVTKGKIFEAFLHALDKCFGISAHIPVYGSISCGLMFILLSAICWLLIRWSHVKD